MSDRSATDFTKNAPLKIACLIGTLMFAVYLDKICPTVFWLDSGEFSAALTTLGLPHSPSFPAFINANLLFGFIPLGDLAFRTNLISVCWSCIACVILFYLLISGRKGEKPTLLRLFLAGCWSCLVFTNSQIFFQAVKVEVYSMNLAFNLTVIIMLFRISENRDQTTSARSRMLMILLFLVFVSAGNHLLLSAHLWPAIIITLLISRFRISFHQISLAAIFASLFGSVYLYLPLRSVKNPPMDIGNPDQWSTFFNGVTRRGSFERFFGNTTVEWLDNVDLYFRFIETYIDFHWMLFVILAGGAYLMLQYRRSLILWIVIMSNIAVTLLNRNFNANPDTGPAYLMISTTLLLSMPLLAVTQILDKLNQGAANAVRRNAAIVLAVAMLLIGTIGSVIQVSSNHTNLEEDFSAAWIGKGILDAVHQNAILFTGFYSNYRFVLDYLTFSERYRDDVEIIDRGEVLYWPGGLQKLLEKHPEWKNAFNNDPQAIRDIEYLAPRGVRHSGRIERIRAQALISSLMARLAQINAGVRPVYWFSSEDDVLLGADVTPSTVLLQVDPQWHPGLFGSHASSLKTLRERTLIGVARQGNDSTRRELAQTLTNLGNSLDDIGQWQKALLVYQGVLEMAPEYDFARRQIQILKERRNL